MRFLRANENHLKLMLLDKIYHTLKCPIFQSEKRIFDRIPHLKAAMLSVIFHRRANNM